MKNILYILALLALISTPCPAEEAITFPHYEDFSEDYSGNVRSTGGCVSTPESSGGWNGNDAAKFTPPTTGDSYCGLGQFTFSSASQLNVRLLVYISAGWAESETRNNKLIIVNPVNNERPMVYMGDYNSGQWQSFAPGQGGALWFEDGGGAPTTNDTFRIGDGNYEDEWVSVELEAIVGTQKINVYVTTIDGVWSGLLRSVDSDVTFDNMTYIDIIGGYFNAGSFSASGTTYYKFSHLQVDDSYIGPPAGFIAGAAASTASGTYSRQ